MRKPPESAPSAAGRVFALLADGTTIEIRQARPGDFNAVKTLHEAMSPDNLYLRFFNLSYSAADNEARRVCREPDPHHAALLALFDGEVIGVASYEVAEGGSGDTAEIAVAVADRMHRRGVATLLLEHLVSLARGHHLRAFTAETLTENIAMLKVFADAGLPVRRHAADGLIQLTFPLPHDGADTTLDAYLRTVERRERSAGVASLRPLLAPESVVVVGASRREGTVGRSILDNIRTGGYAGRLYAVNPHAPQVGGVGGVQTVPSVAALPEAPDLALIAVPPAAVPQTCEDCGRLGVRALTVITSGLDAAASAGLLAACRRHGMRLVGPNCFGIAVPAIGLDATFAASHPRPGIAGLVMQSGGLGFAMVDQLSRLGIGISSFVSVGNKLDVSSNDMLMWWEADGVTRLAVLYIESFGNPRKFARTARRVSASMPVVAVQPGRSAAGQAAAASHTAAAIPPLVSREALFEQAGIIATPSFGELFEVTALLATQPVPAGRTVAIVSNVGGAGVLAADACTEHGLAVHQPRGTTRRRLHTLIPGGGAVTGPVDTTATISGEAFRECLELLAEDDDVDAIIALVLPTGATGDLVAAIQQAGARVPLAAVVLDQAESVRLLPDGELRDGAGRIPSYGYPEAAAAALARAVRYGAWLAEPRGQIPQFGDVRAAEARTLVREFLDTPGGLWLPPEKAAELLRCYGIPLAGEPVTGKPVTGKPVTGGTQVIIGVADDRMFGPLVVFGLGGAPTEVLADRAARLAPLTDTDADKLIHSIRSAPLLLGYRGAPAADIKALREILLRVSRLADDLPEVTELDLNPVIARPDGASVAGARVKVAPYDAHDPFLRKLR